MIEGKPESLFEIGYMLFSRRSIFFISGIFALNAFGLCMVYFITFSEIVKSLFRDIYGVAEGETIEGFAGLLCTKETWVIILACFMLPICLKKEL
jgi:amino acid permease